VTGNRSIILLERQGEYAMTGERKRLYYSISEVADMTGLKMNAPKEAAAAIEG
jgi:hypothetical protein